MSGKLHEKLGLAIETYKLCYITNGHTHSSVRSQVWYPRESKPLKGSNEFVSRSVVWDEMVYIPHSDILG